MDSSIAESVELVDVNAQASVVPAENNPVAEVKSEPTGRNARYKSIMPPERLSSIDATVVGVGAIGRQIAIQLATIGVGSIRLLDHDNVEDVNFGAQGYFPSDLGKPKVKATADLLKQINGDVKLFTQKEKFLPGDFIDGVVFSCVDDMSAREAIIDGFEKTVDLADAEKMKNNVFIDGRMSAEVFRIFVVYDPNSLAYYRKTLFSNRDGFQASCTSRTTFYSASAAASFMILQLSKWMRNPLFVDKDMLFNMLASEMQMNVADEIST